MNENKVLRRLKKGDSAALTELIEQYSAYVYAIASNILGHALPAEDVEEVTADVFTALWYHREKVEPGKLKPYLAAITRNRARSKLRALRIAEPLEDDGIFVAADSPERETLEKELREISRMAVASLPEPDREIFQRHYFLYQKTEDIAREMNMMSGAVRTRLSRGRGRLRAYLEERGYNCEILDI